MIPILSLASMIFLAVSIAASRIGECPDGTAPQPIELGPQMLRASSSFEPGSVGADRGILHNEEAGGAWCPKGFVDRTGAEYLEVSLDGERLVTAVLSQGRYAGGIGREYAEGYRLRYWDGPRGRWVDYASGKDDDDAVILPGNNDTASVASNELSPAILTSRLQIMPHSEHPRTVCMRIGLVGCPPAGKNGEYAANGGKTVEVDLADVGLSATSRRPETTGPAETTGDDRRQETLGILVGVLLTLTTLLLLAIVGIMLRSTRVGSRAATIGPSASVSSIASSVIVEGKGRDHHNRFSASLIDFGSPSPRSAEPEDRHFAAAGLTDTLWGRLMVTEPIYQEPGSPAAELCTANPAGCAFVSDYYSTPAGAEAGHQAYDVYRFPEEEEEACDAEAGRSSASKESFCTEFSYLEETSVDTLPSSLGTPRLPPLPVTPEVPETDHHVVYVNQLDLHLK